MARLETTYLGLKLRNPVIAASSGLTETIKSIIQLEENGAGAIVLKSLFEEEIMLEMMANMSRMNSSTDIYPESVEYYEMHSTIKESTEHYLELIRDAKKAVKIPVIASINCMTASQWTYFPKLIQEAGADALELNLFILPSDFKKTAEENEKVYFDIIREIRKTVQIPIALKVSSYFSNLAGFMQRLSESGIQGLVLFNRFYNPDVDIEKLEVVSSNVMSNSSDISLSLRWIAILAGRVKCDLAATTGVHDAAGVIKQLLVGASAVEIASALYINGPEYLKVMLKELSDWMDAKGYKSIGDFQGKLSQSMSENPAAYERVQFMKYFRGYKKHFHPPL
jgi:dihydroorotate dehydrogenase (fumarate)